MVQLSNSSVVSSGNVETARSALGLGEQSPRMLRMIVLATGAAYFAWQLTIAGLAPSQWGTSFPITVLLAAVCALTYTLSSQRHVAATLTWLAGLALTISAALWLFRSPEVALLYALLPLNGMLIWGWPAALLAEFVATGLVLVASTSPSLRPFPPAYPAIVTLGGAWIGFLSWLARQESLTAARWALFYYEQAHHHVEAARDDRLELEETKHDLIHANQELARLTDRLKSMYQIAEEASHAKEEFVAKVSHELRTPLNMIIGFSEMMPKVSRAYGIELPAALLSDISAIRRNSQHLAQLVDDVLDLSQVEAGRMALSKDWSQIPEIIEQATTAVRTLYQSKGLYLRTSLASDLPPVYCDGTRVRQILINLLSNAGRFTEQGGTEISARVEGDAIHVSVADTGPGIAEADLARAFEPFQQVDGSIRRRHGGSGLGLTISRQFVEMHGGRMRVDSQLGAGSTFSFTLPVDRPLPTAAASGDYARWINPYQQYDPRTRPSRAPAPEVVPRYVLLDPGESLGRLFARYLHEAEIACVNGMESAIDELARSPAQALIINEPMASRGALSTRAALLSHLPYGTPAITCWVPGTQETARRLGVERYLVKPVSMDGLLSALADVGEDVHSVLIVDDETEALQLFARMLSSTDRRYQVLQARNGNRALALMRQRRPDVVLLDLIMPGMDGFQVLREKAADPEIAEIPVIIVSSRDPSGDPIVSETLTLVRPDGLSISDLSRCIQALAHTLAPSARPDDPTPTETPPA